MPNRRVSITTIALLTTCLSVFLAGACAGAQSETVLFRFGGGGQSGDGPYSNLIFDKAGNIYGTTLEGGSQNGGTVFELIPKAGGGWTEKILHNFSNNGVDGRMPYAGVVFDAAGNLYGTTVYGGSIGAGTVFELSPQTGGGWAERILHNFNESNSDGLYPVAGVVFDANGNLYGTTTNGGNTTGSCTTAGCGIVFELTPQTDGSWAETIVHSFNNNFGADGANPWSSLILDREGNLYGTTETGGIDYSGTAYQLKRGTGGQWTETLLHNFRNNRVDGKFPQGALIFDQAGNLYGMTTQGGLQNDGTVFVLTPSHSGSWTTTVLHNFAPNGDGILPHLGTLVFDSAGNLYGTTGSGGLGYGTVFEMSPLVGGGFTESVLYSFKNEDGWYPQAGLIFDAKGNLYGTTLQAGANAYGTVFEITP